ncbi:unnamed protein product [Blepharisma stoltei]|uniref:Jacalin-type lectin domain-containing protein n=1 Tax=Blepharisma stoltei TaxID=1481888 RepID=A0AAU9INT0_9CILI|nr:unnamed protein product [Blepharisma stoltei]
MGCGATYRGPQKPIYSADISSQSITILGNDPNMPQNFPPTGFISVQGETYFDDREFIKQSQIMHLKEINFVTQEYVVGFEVGYYIDGASKLLKHYNKNPGQVVHKAVMNGFDSIIWIEITYGNGFIYSVKMKTLKEREIYVEGTKGKGPETKTVSLIEDKKAITGFKGRYDNYLRSLHTYSWRILKR